VGLFVNRIAGRLVSKPLLMARREANVGYWSHVARRPGRIAPL
jgi:hypothetical protein